MTPSHGAPMFFLLTLSAAFGSPFAVNPAPSYTPACVFGVETRNGSTILMENEIFFRIRPDSPEGPINGPWWSHLVLSFDVHVPHTECPPMQMLDFPLVIQVTDPMGTEWLKDTVYMSYYFETVNMDELISYSITHNVFNDIWRRNNRALARFEGASTIPSIPSDQPTTNHHEIWIPMDTAHAGDCFTAWIPADTISVTDGVRQVRVKHRRIEVDRVFPYYGWSCFQ